MTAINDEPRLLAANPGAIRNDYTNRLDQSARHEPEALTRGQLQDIQSRQNIRREQQNAEAKSMMLAGVNQFAVAGGRERRTLQNLQRAIQNL